MIRFNEVQSQLEAVRSPFHTIGVFEVKYLAKVLNKNEQIMSCLKGWHNGRSGILCATDKRIIIVCVVPNKCSVYEVDYAEVTDIVHSEKKVTAYLTIASHAYTHVFKSWRTKNVKLIRTELKRHLMYIQERTLLESTDYRYMLPKQFKSLNKGNIRALGSAAVAH